MPDQVNIDRENTSSGRVQKRINTAVSTWHAVFPGGSAVNATSGFSNPDAATIEQEADRVPELALAAGGTPGTYVITGLWNDRTQTDSILTEADATAKGSKPFDEIQSIVGPNPGANLTLNKGDSWFDPPTRWIWTGSAAGGDIMVQLVSETTVKKVFNLPAGHDWWRRAQRTGTAADGTTLADLMAVW
jgi:hypothetical protein